MKVCLALILAAFVAHAVWLQCVAEDAYITYRFARNVAEGHGFVWNPGEPPVEGFTNFLWVGISAAAYRLGLDLPRVTQALGVMAGLGTLLVSWRFAREILGVSSGVALFTTALIAAAGPMAAWATSGMETVFFTLWVTAAVYFASRFSRTAALGDAVITALTLFCATLTRPEGFGVAAIVLPAAWWLGTGPENARRVPPALIAAAVYLGAFVIYFAWRYETFGYPLPNTFYAKTGGGLHQYWRGFVHITYFALHFVLPWLPWGLLWAWRAAGDRGSARRSQPRGWFARGRRHAGAVIASAVVVGYTSYVVLVGGDYMAMYRFAVPVLPLLYLLLGLCAHHAVTGLEMNGGRRIVLGAMGLLTAGAVLLQSTPFEQAVFAPTPRMHGTYRGVKVERWYVNRFHVIGHFFADQMPDQSGSILTYDIGVVGYITRFNIYDVLGIVDPTIAHQPAPTTMGSGLPGHEKQDLAYSYSRRPTFVVYTVQLRPAPGAWPHYPPDLDARVRTEYELKSAWLVDAANREEGYFTYLARKRAESPASTSK
jgi:arabinofuranosyltransferase